MISYKEAGVDIDTGNSFVETIKPFVKSTATAGSAHLVGRCDFLAGIKIPRF